MSQKILTVYLEPMAQTCARFTLRYIFIDPVGTTSLHVIFAVSNAIAGEQYNQVPMSWYPHIPTSQLSFYRQIPKVDLHRHLEGSLRVSTMLDIARQHGLEPGAHLTLGKTLLEFGSENILVSGVAFLWSE